jgi:hypothetical protein
MLLCADPRTGWVKIGATEELAGLPGQERKGD